MKIALALLPLLLCAAAPRPVVLELFTSQSCSSCPPADALLASLADTRTDVLALDFHVDYWDYLNWRDRFSSPAATARQRRYAARLGSDVYTPQLVIDGQRQAVGSDRGAVMASLAAAKTDVADGPAAQLSGMADRLTVDVAAGQGSADVLLVGFDPQHVTEVGAGENAGRILREVNVVRSLASIGRWTGTALHLRVPRPAGTNAALLVQAEDGKILAATTVRDHTNGHKE